MKKKLLTIAVLGLCFNSFGQHVLSLNDYQSNLGKSSPQKAVEFNKLLSGGGALYQYANGVNSYKSIHSPKTLITDVASLASIQKTEIDLSQVTLLKLTLANTNDLGKRLNSQDLKSFPALQYIVIESGIASTTVQQAKNILPTTIPGGVTVLFQVSVSQ